MQYHLRSSSLQRLSSKQPKNMDKVESCQPVSSQNQFPNFSKSSCTGTSSAESVAEERSCSEDQVNLVQPFEGKDHFEGWANSLEFFPVITSAIINHTLVEDACSMKGNSSVRTNRNKKLGYRLWKERVCNKCAHQAKCQTTYHNVPC